jgi:hypothetical protein
MMNAVLLSGVGDKQSTVLPEFSQFTNQLAQEGITADATLKVIGNVLVTNSASPFLSSKQAAQLNQAKSLMQSDSPADQLAGLKLGLTVLAQNPGSARNEISAALSEVNAVLNDLGAVLTDNPIADTLSLESSERVGALSDYIGKVKELAGKLEQLGIDVESSPMRALIAEFDSGQLTSFSELSDAIALFQTGSIQLLSPKVADLAGFDSVKLAEAGAAAKTNQTFDTNVALSLDDTLDAHIALTELDLTTATKEDVAAARAVVESTLDKRAAELGIPTDPKARSPAERQIAQNDPMLSLLQIDMDWLGGLSAKLDSGQSLSRVEHGNMFTELAAKYNTGMKEVLNYLTALGETDTALYKDVEDAHLTGQAKLNEQKTILNLVLQRLA